MKRMEEKLQLLPLQVLHSYADPKLVEDDRVLKRLLRLEEFYVPTCDYFKVVQSEIKPFMRRLVIGWMLDVCEEQQCEDDVFPLAVNIFDRFMGVNIIQKTQLQLLGSVCLFLASKLRETFALSAEKLVVYTDNSITMEELLLWEVLVLNKLKWDVAGVVANDFLDYMFSRLNLPECCELSILRRHSSTYIALSHIDFLFCSLNPPSMIAAAAICTSVQGLRQQLGSLCPTLSDMINRVSKLIGVDEDCLRQCQQRMEEVVRNSLDSTSMLSPEHTPDHRMDSENKSPTDEQKPLTPTDVLDISF